MIQSIPGRFWSSLKSPVNLSVLWLNLWLQLHLCCFSVQQTFCLLVTCFALFRPRANPFGLAAKLWKTWFCYGAFFKLTCFFSVTVLYSEAFSSSSICPVAELTAGVSYSNESVDESREPSLLCWELLLVCCWPSLPAAHSAKRELLSQAAGHSQYLSDPQLFRLPRPLQSLSPETPAVLAGQSAHVYVWDRLRPEALPF